MYNIQTAFQYRSGRLADRGLNFIDEPLEDFVIRAREIYGHIINVAGYNNTLLLYYPRSNGTLGCIEAWEVIEEVPETECTTLCTT